VTLLFGWWGIPWGIFWSLEALGTNLFGGKQPAKENAHLLRLLALQFMAGNQILNAIQALRDSLLFEYDAKTEEFLQYLAASADVAPRPPSFLRRNRPAIVYIFIGIFLCIGISLCVMYAISSPPPPPAEQTPTSKPVPPSPTPSLTLYLADFIEILGKIAEDGNAIIERFDSEYEATNQFLDISEEEWWDLNDEFAWRFIVLYDEGLNRLSELSVPSDARTFHDEFVACAEKSRSLMIEARSAIAERSEAKFGQVMANGGRLQEQCMTTALEEWDRLSELVAP